MSELSTTNVLMRINAIKTLLRNRPTLLSILFPGDGKRFDTTANPDTLDLEDTADILARLAWDIWNGAGSVEFDRVLHELPEEDFEAFIDSMKDFAALRKKIRHAYATGTQND
ncbi:MAG: hypothetical protein HY751_02935 [Nitrospinae bacterium]|nr:hypothetical protein [Nitrospinota bacterium]